MNLTKTRFNGLSLSAVFAAVLLAAPAVSSAQSTSSGPVVCNDGTTSPHGGRGACSGHGGVNKSGGASGRKLLARQRRRAGGLQRRHDLAPRRSRRLQRSWRCEQSSLERRHGS